jgi:predicted RNase H-like nuclease (RuvC/YqgF family)
MKQLLVKFRLEQFGTCLAIALVMSVVSGSPPALSADKKDLRQREAQRRTQQAIKKAESKNTELEQANTELAAQLKEKEQNAMEILSRLEGSTRKNKRLADDLLKEQSRVEELEARLKEAESKLLQTQTEFAQLGSLQRQAQLQLQMMTAEKSRLDDTLGICLGKNERLYQFGRELISHVEKPQGFAGILRAEPFTQINRVQLENIVQDARDNLDQNHMPPVSARVRDDP